MGYRYEIHKIVGYRYEIHNVYFISVSHNFLREKTCHVKCIWAHLNVLCLFAERNNFCDFQIASPEDEALQKKKIIIICSYKFFPLELMPILKGAKNRVTSPQCVPIHHKQYTVVQYGYGTNPTNFWDQKI